MLQSKLTKIASILMAMVLAASTLVSCSSNKETSETSSGSVSSETTSSKEESKEEENTEHAENPLRSDKRRTLTVELFDRGVVDGDATCDNNYTTDFIREDFGEFANADVEFTLVPRWEDLDKLNVMMASKSAPDICFTYNRDLVFQYAMQGGLTPLDEWYDQCSRLQAKLGDDVNYGKCDGKLVSVVGQKEYLGQYVTVIRKDWLDALGLEAPTTRDEWHEVLKAFKEKDPGQLGDQNYPFLIQADTEELRALLWSFVDPNLSEKDNFTLPHLLLPGWKEGFRFMNTMYNEGLINPEFMLDQNKTMYSEAKQKGAWGSTRGMAPGSSCNTDNYEANPDIRIMTIDPFVNEAGEHKKDGNPAYSLFNFVPSFSKNGDLAMQYFEWMAQREVGLRMNYGIENIHWEYDENNYIMPIAPQDRPDEWKERMMWQSKDWYLLDSTPDAENGVSIMDQHIANEVRRQEQEYDEKFPGNTELKEFVLKEVPLSINNALEDMFVDLRIFPNYEIPLESVSKYQTNLNKIYQDGYVKCVTASPEEFDAAYDALTDQYLQAGGQAVIDEKTAYWDARHS